MDTKLVANSYLAMALTLGALLPVMLSIATSMNTYEFLFLTYLISVPASFVFVLAMRKKAKLFKYLKSWRSFAAIAAIGLLNYAFLEFGLSYAERFVSASLATVVYRTFPLLMLLFLPILLKERISKYQGVALLLAFAGLYIALSNGTGNVLVTSNIGIMLFLVGVAFSGALATVLVKKYTYDMESSMFIFNLANFAFFTLLFVLQGMPSSASVANNIIPLMYVGIVYNVFVGFMYYGALRMMKTTFVTNIYFLSPFLTFVFANFILGEAIRAYYILIAVLVTAGILIQRFDKVGGSYAKAGRPSEGPTLFDVTGAFLDSKHAGISAAIENGDRVLALKIHGRHHKWVSWFLENGNYNNTFIDDHSAVAEQSSLVRDLLAAKNGEIVLLKAGDVDESEKFFVTISKSLEDIETAQKSDLPNEQNQARIL